MSVSRTLATQGFNNGTNEAIEISQNPRLPGYRYRWIVERKIITSSTPLTQKFGSNGAGTYFGFSDELPEGYENLEGFSCACTLIEKGRSFYKAL